MADAAVLEAPGAGTMEMQLEDARQVRVSSITTNPWQPRRRFDPAKMAELRESIRRNGLLQRLVVRPAGEANRALGFDWELIAGERRWRNLTELGWTYVPVDVRHVDDRTMAVLAATENIHRDGLNPVEEARSFEMLIAEFGYTQAEVAAAVLLDASRQPLVSQLLGLLDLPAALLALVEDGLLAWTHARDVLRPFLKRGTQAQREIFFGAVAEALRDRADGRVLDGRTVEEIVSSNARDAFPEEPAEPGLSAPRWVLDSKDREALLARLAGDYARQHGLSNFSSKVNAFRSGAIWYFTGRELGDASTPADLRGDADARRVGWAAAEAEHLAASAVAERGFRHFVARGDPAQPGSGWRVEEVFALGGDTEEVVVRLRDLPAAVANEIAGAWCFGEDVTIAETVYACPAETRCRVCGCTDSRACPDGCTWIEVDRKAGTGLCSNPACRPATAEPVTAGELVHALHAPGENPAADAAVQAHVEAARRATASPGATTAAESPRSPVAAPPRSSLATDGGAAPLTTLPLPGSARPELPEGAGIITALDAAMGGRPCTLSVQRIGAQVMVIIAPRLAKAGESPLQITKAADQIDAELLRRIDQHFK